MKFIGLTERGRFRVVKVRPGGACDGKLQVLRIRVHSITAL